MLAADLRLRSTRDITAVFKQGTRIRTPHLYIYVLPRPQQMTSRAACVVSTRVSRSSVIRHRYQRWLREAARQAIREVFTAVPCDSVWVAQSSIARLQGSTQLAHETLPFLKKYVVTTTRI